MADSQRQQVLAVLATRLQAARLDNDFRTDAGSTVFLGETPDLGPDDPKEAIAIVPQEDAPRVAGRGYLIGWPVSIQALSQACLDDAWSRIEMVLADIKQAIELDDDRRLDGLLTGAMERGVTRTLPREPGSLTVGVEVMYLLQIKESWGTP